MFYKSTETRISWWNCEVRLSRRCARNTVR